MILPFARPRRLSLPVFVALGLLLGACTYVPFSAPRPEVTLTRAPLTSPAMIEIARSVSQNGNRNGFIPLVEGNDALGARLSMINAAVNTIDIQYFLLKPDLSGSLVALALIEAAERGVVVRVLLDDVFTTADDAQLALLDSSPGIQVRVFNPLSRNSPLAMAYVLDFDRTNRRMHNKTFVVDGAMAIIGGRNIADEYFQVSADSEFADFDLFLAGPVIADITASFDVFWADPWSLPISAFASPPDLDLTATRGELDARAQEAARGLYQRAVGSSYLADVRAGRIEAAFANAVVVSDTPAKLKRPVKGGSRPLAETLMQAINGARTQVTVLTPYFVPEDWGAKMFSDLAARGVRVRIVTNSLAANNHPYVHAGYMRHREALLAAGVELYEVRADAPAVLGQVPEGSDTKLTLHTKMILIDDNITFIGSLNFDPRSIKLNSEFGLFLEDRAITQAVLSELNADYGKFTYRLSLAPDGTLRWTYNNGALREQVTSEPGAGFWAKFVAGLTSLLPVEGQL